MILLAALAWVAAAAAATIGWRARARAPRRAGGRAEPLPPLLRALGAPTAPAVLRDGLERLCGRWAGTHAASALPPPARPRLASARVWATLLAAGTAAALAPGPIPARAVAAAAGAVGAMAALEAWLRATAARRRMAVLMELPDLLETLALLVEAGLGLIEVLRDAAAGASGPLRAEIDETLCAIDLGVARRPALLGLAERCAVDEVRRAVAALLDADELGAPLAGVLAGQAASVRAARLVAVRERAAAAGPKIQLAVALTMVPAAMILVLGVLVIDLARRIGGVL